MAKVGASSDLEVELDDACTEPPAACDDDDLQVDLGDATPSPVRVSEGDRMSASWVRRFGDAAALADEVSAKELRAFCRRVRLRVKGKKPDVAARVLAAARNVA